MPPFDSMAPEEVWDLVHFIQSLRVEAHEAELLAAGLKEQDRLVAREKIWALISDRADELKVRITKAPEGVAAPEQDDMEHVRRQ